MEHAVTMGSLRAEFAAHDQIGEQMYALCLTVGKSVVQGYPAKIYSSLQQEKWDDVAVVEAVHLWLAEMHKKMRTWYWLTACETVPQLYNGLKEDFRQHLIAKHKRTTLGNLFDRAHALLESDPRFSCVTQHAPKARRPWGLTAWTQGCVLYDGAEKDLVESSYAIKVDVYNSSQQATRNSACLSNAALAQFMADLLASVGTYLCLAQFTHVFRYRFNLLEAEVISLDYVTRSFADGDTWTPRDTVVSAESTEEEALLNLLVPKAARSLTPRQQTVLREYMQVGATYRKLEKVLKLPHTTINGDFQAAIKCLCDFASTDIDPLKLAERVCKYLETHQQDGA